MPGVYNLNVDFPVFPSKGGLYFDLPFLVHGINSVIEDVDECSFHLFWINLDRRRHLRGKHDIEFYICEYALEQRNRLFDDFVDITCHEYRGRN